MSNRLQQVELAGMKLRDLKARYAKAVVDFENDITAAKLALDDAIVGAAEEPGLTNQAISVAAGYKSRATVRDARRRINERREAEVR